MKVQITVTDENGALLRKDLSDRKWVSQNLAYAHRVVGVQRGPRALTNGDEYRIYNSHAAVDVAPTRRELFRSVRVPGADTKTPSPIP